MATPDILGLEVPIGAIEARLRKLWEADQASTKASLINFAVYSESPDALAANTALLAEITRDHSCRALLIGARLDHPDSNARAWITAHCHLAGGRKSVCSEQIAFQLDGKAIGRIRNVVFAHLESDLPVVLWWQGEFSRIFEPRLLGLVDRLIFDSATWGDFAAQYRMFAEALRLLPDRLAVHDLEWTRTYQLRLALAALFDDPAAAARLPDIAQVRIAHHPKHRIAALYLAAWLAERLGWQGGLVLGNLDLRNGSRALRVELAPAESASGPIAALELTTEDAACFAVERDPGTPYYRTRSGPCASPHRGLSPADPDSLVRLVSAQLERAGTNTLFRRILPVFTRLAGTESA